MTYEVNEIFASVQGEGEHAGTPCVFIRLAGCNLDCPFCDTKYAAEGRPTEIGDIVAEAQKFDPRYAVLTGGEPMRQNVRPLVEELKLEGFYVAVETNGTYKIPRGLFDRITVSPKSCSLVQTSGDEMKLLWGIAPDPDSMRVKYPGFNRYSLQPVSGRDIRAVAAYVIEHPWWRLSLQMHRYARLR